MPLSEVKNMFEDRILKNNENVLTKTANSVSGQIPVQMKKSSDPFQGNNKRKPSVSRDSLLSLQRSMGNQFIQRAVLDIARKEDDQVQPEIEQGINRMKGGGQALDQTVQAQMESSFGTDFSNVWVHTGGQADTLNRSLNARAFTTGSDIFFGQGNYNPGSSAGRELLAHELTHVVQQNDEIQTKLSLGQPGDVYEQEADEVARTVMRQSEETVQAQPEEEEENLLTKRK
jgi:hypothetical protein